MQEKQRVMVAQYRLKILSPGTTVQHHEACRTVTLLTESSICTSQPLKVLLFYTYKCSIQQYFPNRPWWIRCQRLNLFNHYFNILDRHFNEVFNGIYSLRTGWQKSIFAFFFSQRSVSITQTAELLSTNQFIRIRISKYTCDLSVLTSVC